jgi:hypothetical protein
MLCARAAEARKHTHTAARGTCCLFNKNNSWCGSIDHTTLVSPCRRQKLFGAAAASCLSGAQQQKAAAPS